MPLLSRRLRALPRKHSKKTPYSTTRSKVRRALMLQPTNNHIIHSFLTSTMDEVKAVCSKLGGKQYLDSPSKNLCISNNDFKFFTVTWDKKVYKKKEETKRLILACDKFGDKCLPTHFEPHGKKPINENGKGCGA
ncbi:unnamed protein product [Arctogadus glacialis]